jgi:hypothetical protein
MCILPSNVGADIIKKHDILNIGIQHLHVLDEIQNLSFWFNMCINSQSATNIDFKSF